MQVEIARPTDVDRIVALVNDAYRGSSKQPGWTHETALLAGQRVDATVGTPLRQDLALVILSKALNRR